MDKNRLFQYAYNQPISTIVVDTELITKQKADELWDKYYNKVQNQLNNGSEPQMCIWKGCETNSDYHTVEREIDFRD